MSELKASRRKTQTAQSVTLDGDALGQVLRLAPVGPAAACLGTLKKGMRMAAVTAGQFSLIDILRAVLDQTGPADVLCCAWTVGIRDAEVAGWLLHNGGLIRSLRFLVHDRFPATEPAYCGRMVEIFGPEVFTLARIHAKVLVVQNERWAVVIQSSMNLNRNDQWEQFTLDESAPLARFYWDLEAKIRADIGPGVHWTPRDVTKAHNATKAAAKDEIAPLLAEYEKRQEAKAVAEQAAAAAAQPIDIPDHLEFLRSEYTTLDAAQKAAVKNGQSNAVDKLSAQKKKIYDELRTVATASTGALTPAEAAEQLRRTVEAAPRALQFQIYNEIAERHPDFTAIDEEDEEETPSVLRSIPGGRR